MIRPEVNRVAIERLKNLLLALGWGSLGVLISILMITYLSEHPVQIVEEVRASKESEASSWIPLAVMLVGIITMIGMHIWLDQEPTHWAERLSQGYSGPLTSVEMVELKSKLAVQALADNLAISPIGDLWQSPW
jgi:preprotein translocase subunit SecY